MNTIALDLWGGHNLFDIDSCTFILNRQYGLFSNITVAMYGICKIKSLGYNVKHLNLYLSEYIDQYNFYLDLFEYKYINNTDEIISTEEADIFMNTVHPTSHGLSRGWNQFVSADLIKIMPIINKIYNHYFVNNYLIQQLYNNIVIKNNISFNNSVFIWARKTDKVHETQMPSAQDYLSHITNYNISNIYVQTDDKTVISEFEGIGDNRIKFLTEIPLSDSSSGFHERLYNVDDNTFYEKYNMSKQDYLRTLLAMTQIAAKCEYFISYPGNLTTMLPILRQSFDKCILFLNDKELVHQDN